MSILNAMPGAVAQGLIWGLMAIGVYISYKILDIADLTVDGSLCTGGCVCAFMLMAEQPIWLCILAAFAAGALAGVVTGLLHTLLGCAIRPSTCRRYSTLSTKGKSEFIAERGW